jgi:hypothetical protein
MQTMRRRPLEYELKAPPLTLIVRRSTEQQWCYELHSIGPNPVGGIWSDGFYPTAQACAEAMASWLLDVGQLAQQLVKPEKKKRKRR